MNFWRNFGNPLILKSGIIVSPHVVHWTPTGLEITFQTDGLSVTLLSICILTSLIGKCVAF